MATAAKRRIGLQEAAAYQNAFPTHPFACSRIKTKAAKPGEKPNRRLIAISSLQLRPMIERHILKAEMQNAGNEDIFAG